MSEFEGLFVLVKPNGSKLLRFKHRIDSKESLLSIGVYPDVTIAPVRKAKEPARSYVAERVDPSEAKQEGRLRLEAKGQTFEKRGNEGKSATTLSKTVYHLTLASRDFGRKPITEITAPMIL